MIIFKGHTFELRHSYSMLNDFTGIFLDHKHDRCAQVCPDQRVPEPVIKELKEAVYTYLNNHDFAGLTCEEWVVKLGYAEAVQ